MSRPVVALLLGALSALNAAAVVYVDKDATGGGNGTSWADAFTEIQDGIDAAFSGGGDEVWVAAPYEDAYDETRPSATGSVVLEGGVHLYGGFAGGETARTQRDPAGNVTIIDGVNGRGPGMRARHVIVCVSNSTVDGFTITRGQADGAAAPDNCGGGIYCASVDATCVIANCTLHDNVADESGGGMYNSAASPTVTSCTFSGNQTVLSGFNHGGGGMHNGLGSGPAITDCVFSGNYSAADGGGMYNTGGSSPAVFGCAFSGNAAPSGSGGGMYNVADSSPAVTACVFSNNLADSIGGGMCNEEASPTVINGVFSGNAAATGSGGGIGSVAYVGVSLPVITNCTFWDNTALFSGGAVWSSNAGVKVTNGILWGDVPDEVDVVGAGTVTITYSDVEGGYPGEGNIGGGAGDDPDFVHAASGDFHIEDTSPCIDTGTATGAPADDLDGIPRPQATGIDMGAFEFWLPPEASFTALPEAGYAPLEVAFTDTSYPGTSPITSWAWDFGDTGTSPDPNPNHTYNAADTYSVTLGVATAVGSDASDPLSVTVADHLQIVQQPVGGSKPLGGSHTFGVGTSGGLYPLTYRWHKDGIEIPGATRQTYAIASLELSDAGNYYAVVSDSAADERTSAEATLFVTGGMPAATATGLALLLAACALAGAARLAKKR